MQEKANNFRIKDTIVQIIIFNILGGVQWKFKIY